MNISAESIATYNGLCKHYDIVANACYEKRKAIKTPLDEEYFPFLIAALIVFDMQRQMDKGIQLKYDPRANGFASRLKRTLTHLRDDLAIFENISIDSIEIDDHKACIKAIYETLSKKNGLTTNGKAFHVGATKILHFMYPGLFPIIDSNAAKIMRKEFHVQYQASGSPGYSAKKYVQSMSEIQKVIADKGIEFFKGLEPGTPLTRIFDKLAFVEAAELSFA